MPARHPLPSMSILGWILIVIIALILLGVISIRIF
jgi:hypothetical protein